MGESAMATSEPSPGIWSEMADDVLELILKRLCLKDWYRCGAVCSSWRSVVTKPHHRLPPLLMLEYDKPKTQTYRHFFTMFDRQFHKIPITAKFRRKYEANRPTRCHGYFGGWLFIDASNGAGLKWYYLQDPISRKHIDLPPNLSWPVVSVVMSSAPTSRDCIVVVELGTGENIRGAFNLRSRFSRFALHRSGEGRWKEFVTAETSPAVSMCFHRGQLFVMDRQRSVRAYALDPKPRVVAAFDLHSALCETYKVNLVDGGDELLLVGRRYWPCEFVVFRLDARVNKWIKADSLGDRVVLLNRDGSSACFSGKDCRFIGAGGFCGNCIYHYGYDGRIVSVYTPWKMVVYEQYFLNRRLSRCILGLVGSCHEHVGR